MELSKLRAKLIAETKEKLMHIPEDKLAIKLYRKNDKKYEKILKKITPNLTELIGLDLTIELLASTKSLKKLAFMTSSQIQIIGAEKALFRHLKSGTKSPKYGIILKHESVQDSDNKAKAARKLSAKISLAAKKDYFSNE